ncbi:SusC/RagA family TonB-linked outer membrane protein [Niabella ginsengisoli]|uniref:TonB-dependent receptor n=1 Tax=Niabella ginsengisoli TaxID=522298 RepID=A0ABS9SPN8_9BACT|nr:TonB-dependent receptor [Niabella ginsengisoli]MCH5600216.1 TonB-dependent receptor [Niabella ginsengisoli]
MIRLLLTILIAVLCLNVSAQTKAISGTVLDDGQIPLEGVNVALKDENVATQTDSKGKFSINIPDKENVELTFSYSGYVTQTISPYEEMIVSLLKNVVTADEVVVIGYGTVTRKSLAGAVSSIKGKELEKAPVVNIAEALTGRLPGVQVTTVDGAPGAEIVIRVRGGGSITQDNSPLYIVDGFIVDNINDIAPSDVEAIDVLKDASSTAIYGSRGANGVVIITTKNPKAGKTKISYNNFFQSKYMPKELAVLSPYEFALLHYEYGLVRGTSSSEYTNFKKFFGEYDDLELYKYQTGTNWQHELFGGAIRSSQHNISITGGTDKTKVSFSSTYNNDEGLMLNSGQKRFYFNFKLNHELFKNLKLDLSARFTNNIIDGAGTSGSSSVRISDGIQTRPINGLADYLEINPIDIQDGEDEYDNFIRSLVNPVDLAVQDYRQRTNRDLSLGAALTYNPWKHVTLRSELATTLRNGRNLRYWGPLTGESRNIGNAQPLGEISISTADVYRFINTANFNILSNKKHDIVFLLGHELNFAKGRTTLNKARYFDEGITPEVLFANMALGTPYLMETRELRGEDMVSAFTRVNYTFLNKYVLYATLRADGSSKFAPGNRWGYFPSASFAWKIAEEEFMQNVNFVNDLKLRLSYGQSGNNRIANDSWRFLFGPSQNRPYGAGDLPNTYYTIVNSSLPNPNLQWETTVSRNLGLDFSLFKNKLSGVIDVYKNTVKGLIIDNAIPSNTGFTSQLINLGQTSNRGFEIGLNAPIIEKGDYGLSVSFNIGRNIPKIDRLDGNDTRMFQSNWAGTDLKTQDDYLLQTGKTIGLIYGYVADGFYTVDDFESYNSTTRQYVLKEGIAPATILGGTIGVRPGTMKLKDLDGDGQITADNDRRIIGNAIAKHSGGFGLNARVKSFDMSTFFNWVYGNDIYNTGRIQYNMLYRTTFGNISDRMNSSNRFKYVNEQGQLVTSLEDLAELNKNATIWSPFSMGGASPVITTDAIEDGSFLRMTFFTIGYTLPKKLTSHVGIASLRLFGTVYNAFVWTKYTGYDPEVSTTRSSAYAALTPGVDYSAYPKSRTFTFGLNVNFK